MSKGSAEFQDQYGGLAPQSGLYQQALRYDQQEQQKKADQKESAVMGVYRHKPSNYGPMPSDEQRKAQEEYLQARAEYHAQAAQERGARAQLLKQQEQDLRSGNIEGISVQSLYDQGRLADNPKVKVQFFWQALTCGHKAAAYDLYEAFHTGLNGAIKQNEVAAVTFVHVGSYLHEGRCMALWSQGQFKVKDSYKAYDGLSLYCMAAARDYQGKVTPEMLEEQVKECNQAISNQFGPYSDIDKLINAPIEAAGQDGDSPCCLIL